MELREYQVEAAKTDQVRDDSDRALLVSLLGLAGEVGTLLAEYKKFLRDGHAHSRFADHVAEDLGDLLWYVANTASRFGLDLDEVAIANLDKTTSRWPTGQDDCDYKLFDDGAPDAEQLPRTFDVVFIEMTDGEAARVVVIRDGQQLGDSLTDNASVDDGYRFHDVFHFAYAAVLGWSPLSRKLLGRKRKSDPQRDEVEDGARARIIEEMISQLVFTYARQHKFLADVSSLDYHLLKTVQSLVEGREVAARSIADWERAIFDGYAAWRRIRKWGGGLLHVDLVERKLIASPIAAHTGQNDSGRKHESAK